MHFVKGHHGIFIPQYSDVYIPETKIGISGHITVELIDAKTKRIKRKLEFNNLITNGGLDALASKAFMSSGFGATRFCGVGTGSTAPANTDTTLVAEILPRAQNSGFSPPVTYTAGPPDYYEASDTYLFLESAANGNLTEVGFFELDTPSTLFSRQLFKDDLGTPTTIIKTSSDQLRITYKVRVYPPVADVVSSGVDISGSAYDVTVRPLRVTTTEWNSLFTQTMSGFFTGSIIAYSGSLPTRNASTFPSGFLGNASTNNMDAYVSGNYFLTASPKWEPANIVSSIGMVGFRNNMLLFGVGFSPVLPKTNTKRLTLNVKVSWARHV